VTRLCDSWEFFGQGQFGPQQLQWTDAHCVFAAHMAGVQAKKETPPASVTTMRVAEM